MSGARRLLPLKVGGVWLAIDALAAVEVLGPRTVVQIPGADAAVPGVIAWRGRAIAVVELTVAIGAGAAGAPRERVVVVELPGAAFALPVEAVHEVHDVPAEAMRPAHGARLPHAALEVELDGAPVPVLELDALLAALLPGKGAA